MFKSFKTFQLLECVCVLVFLIFYDNKQHIWVSGSQSDIVLDSQNFVINQYKKNRWLQP